MREDIGINKNISEFSKNSFLEGYWGNENYFNEIREILLTELKIKQEHQSDLFHFYKNEISQFNSVSIHIRRGDYLEVRNKSIFENLDLQYYKDAIALIVSKIPNPKFYIFSDDIIWTKSHLPIEADHVYVNEANTLKDFEELILMSFCKHNIIANSTFSWWAAWLNTNVNKLVLQPKIWYRDLNLQRSYKLNQTLYSGKFIRI